MEQFNREEVQRKDQYHERLRQLHHKDIALPRTSKGGNVTTATQILELIKKKRQQLTGVPKSSTEQKLQPLSKPHTAKELDHPPSKQIVLPKLKTESKSDISLEVEPRSTSLEYSKLRESQTGESDKSKRGKNSSKRYITEDIEQINQNEQLQQIHNTEAFQGCLNQLPRLTKFRSLQNMQPLINFLKQSNPFFKNTPQMLVSSLLKVCRILHFSKSQKIYNRTDKLTSFYIILWGRVRISDTLSEFRKVSVRGETLSQHALFDNTNPKLRFQNAKALSQTWVLQIPVFLYKKIFEELVLYGYKGDFLAMESLFKRNYIFKQSLKAKST